MTHTRLAFRLVKPSVTLRFPCFYTRDYPKLKQKDFLLRNVKHLHTTLLERDTIYPHLMQAIFFNKLNSKRRKKSHSHDTAPFWPRSPVKPCCPGIPGGPGGPCSHNPSPKKQKFNRQFVLD